MDECPICGCKALVASGGSPQGNLELNRSFDRFICWECLIQWPTQGPRIYKPYTGSVMSLGHS